MKSIVKVDERFAAAMGSRRFGSNGTSAPAAAAAVRPATLALAPSPALRDGDIHIGDSDTGGPIGISPVKLLEGRLLIQGASGAGKSWTLRRLLEKTSGIIQQIVVDPEGEFKGLAEKLGHVHIEAHRLDTVSLATAARRAREHRLSVLVDLSELDREGQMIAVAAFFQALIEAPREHWHPVLVAVDEAHLFAPFGGQAAAATSVRKAAIGAVTDLMSRGRKRGLTGVLATQRLARLAKSVASEVHNFMVGLNTLDLDIRRAAETIGWDARKAFDRLPMLEPGDFVAVGPAFSRSPSVLRVGSIRTRHVGAAPALAAPADLDPRTAAKLLELDALVEASAADAEVRAEDALVPGLRAVREFIRDPAFPLAGRIWGELAELPAAGAVIAAMPKHFGVPAARVHDALALLDRCGAVEFMGEGKSRAVRIAKEMRP